jgi:hypothetical protein
VRPLLPIWPTKGDHCNFTLHLFPHSLPHLSFVVSPICEFYLRLFCLLSNLNFTSSFLWHNAIIHIILRMFIM